MCRASCWGCLRSTTCFTSLGCCWLFFFLLLLKFAAERSVALRLVGAGLIPNPCRSIDGTDKAAARGRPASTEGGRAADTGGAGAAGGGRGVAIASLTGVEALTLAYRVEVGHALSWRQFTSEFDITK